MMIMQWSTFKTQADDGFHIMIEHRHSCGNVVVETWIPSELREWLLHGLRPEEPPLICNKCNDIINPGK